METTREFYPGERYRYDIGLCSNSKGFAQVDTKMDAHYFGIWANPTRLVVFSYIEGDCITRICENTKEFVEELRAIRKFYGDDFRGIDPGFSSDLKQSFIDIGLGDLLH